MCEFEDYMTGSRPPQRLMAFRVKEHAFALRLEAVREVIPMARLSSPPGMPPLLLGFLNLGGVAIPVVRLDRLFRLPDQEIGLFTPLLLVQLGSSPVALLADRVLGVLGSAEPVSIPVDAQHTFNGCVDSVVQWAGDSVHVLDLECLLLEQERRCVADFQSMEEQRLKQLPEARP